MKGSAITGPVGKEAADLWPVSYPHFPPSYPMLILCYPQRIASNSGVVM